MGSDTVLFAGKIVDLPHHVRRVHEGQVPPRRGHHVPVRHGGGIEGVRREPLVNRDVDAAMKRVPVTVEDVLVDVGAGDVPRDGGYLAPQARQASRERKRHHRSPAKGEHEGIGARVVGDESVDQFVHMEKATSSCCLYST